MGFAGDTSTGILLGAQRGALAPTHMKDVV